MKGCPSFLRLKFGLKCFGVLFLLFLSFLCQLLFYLFSEFVFCTNREGQSQTTIGKRRPNSTIPKNIHQVYFFITDKELPKKYVENQESWIKQNPDYHYTLWNATMIEQLIQDNYPEVAELYHSYGHWIRRSDVARYLVLHQYGGVYVDIDLKCRKPISHLLKNFENKGIVMYETTPFGVTNDFLVTETRHPFFAYVIQGLKYSNRWYIFPHAQTMLSTGPTYLTGRYYNFDQKDDIHILNREYMRAYFNRTGGFKWHGWDIATIKWYNDNWSVIVPFTKYSLGLIFVFVALILVRKLLSIQTAANT